ELRSGAQVPRTPAPEPTRPRNQVRPVAARDQKTLGALPLIGTAGQTIGWKGSHSRWQTSLETDKDRQVNYNSTIEKHGLIRPLRDDIPGQHSIARRPGDERPASFRRHQFQHAIVDVQGLIRE